MTLHDILIKHWGYSHFRPKQEDIIHSVLKGQDTLGLLPTGGGKSICFQVPAMLLDGICIVISPLIALMHDQVQSLNSKGIKAIAITSGMTYKQIDIAMDNAIYGDTKFLYVSPERLKTKLFQTRFIKMNVNLIAVDEAHCISQWGYDFRPPYLTIAELRTLKPKVPFLALTATATPKVVEDIQEKLEFKSKHTIQSSFKRDNVAYITLPTNNKLGQIIEYAKKIKGSGIVYCSTRKATKYVAKILLENGVSANFYHGGLTPDQRKDKQATWINNQVKVMVATNAFGMGIDKPDVRFVLHYNIPETIEAYFQEAGRAGRDLEKSRAILFFEPNELLELKQKIELKFPPIDTIKQIYNALGNYFQLAIGSGLNESFEFNISNFANQYNLPLLTVYNALKFLELENLIQLNENVYQSSQLKVTANQMELYQYQVKNKDLNHLIQFILRSHPGIFDDYIPINESIISQKIGIKEKELMRLLMLLNDQEVVDYSPKFTGAQLIYLTERLAPNNVSISPQFYKERKQDALDKYNAMERYLQNDICRSQYLLSYFGETNSQKCGICNVCLNDKRKNFESENLNSIRTQILMELNSQGTFQIQDFITKHSNYNREKILECLRLMSEHHEIYIENHEKVSLGIKN